MEVLAKYFFNIASAALKIIVTLQQCYLAYVVFETRKPASIIVPASKVPESAIPSAAPSAIPSVISAGEASVIPSAISASVPTATSAPIVLTSTAAVSLVNSPLNFDDTCTCVKCPVDNLDNVSNTKNQNTNNINTTTRPPKEHKTSSAASFNNRYIKYYDRLTDIPHGKIMQHCRYGPIRAGKDIKHPDLVLLSNVYDSMANSRSMR